MLLTKRNSDNWAIELQTSLCQSSISCSDATAHTCSTRPAHKQPRHWLESVPLCLDDQSTICCFSALPWSSGSFSSIEILFFLPSAPPPQNQSSADVKFLPNSVSTPAAHHHPYGYALRQIAVRHDSKKQSKWLLSAHRDVNRSLCRAAPP